MKTSRSSSLLAAALAVGTLASIYSSNAATINVLWYTGGVEDTTGPVGDYKNNVLNLAAAENTAFNLSGSLNTWNVTFWDSGPKPAGTFNVLVGASKEGGWNTAPNYSALSAGVTASSFGDRIMLSGQDADWHLMNFPGKAAFDGPAGFLIDAVNWAGSGTGMGGVFLSTGLENSLFGATIVGDTTVGNNTVIIPGPVATNPVNKGLSSAGLSNWSTSAHDEFTGSLAGWTPINIDSSGNAITIVTAATAGGGTDGTVPEPTTIVGGIMMAGLAASKMLRRKKA